MRNEKHIWEKQCFSRLHIHKTEDLHTPKDEDLEDTELILILSKSDQARAPRGPSQGYYSQQLGTCFHTAGFVTSQGLRTQEKGVFFSLQVRSAHLG